jgi:Xaa-Pro aminopeptidase
MGQNMFTEKVQQAIDILREKQIDMWLTFERESKINRDPMHDYLSSCDVTWQSAFIITAAGQSIAIVGNLDAAEFKQQPQFTDVHSYTESIRPILQQILEQHRPGKIAINYSKDTPTADGLTVGLHRQLLEYLSGTCFETRLVSAEPVINALRGRKTASEIEHMRRAASITEAIFQAVTNWLMPGVTEKQIAAFILEQVDRRHLTTSWDKRFCPAVFTGPETAGAHAAPTERQVQYEHLLNIDFGVKVNGYCADLQRTWYLKHPDKPVPESVLKGFEVLRTAMDKAEAALRPGVTGKHIDEIARNFLMENGYEPYPHALGHQLGREAHDGGALLAPAWERYGETPFIPIETGEVYTIEPRLSVPHHGTISLEEEVWIQTSEIIHIDHPQRELWVVEK